MVFTMDITKIFKFNYVCGFYHGHKVLSDIVADLHGFVFSVTDRGGIGPLHLHLETILIGG